MLAALQEPGDPDLLAEIVTLYLRDTPERLRELRERSGDAGEIARVAHVIKGSSANLGASGLQELAARLEAAAQGNQGRDALHALVDAVAAEYVRVEQHLRDVLATRASSSAGDAE